MGSIPAGQGEWLYLILLPLSFNIAVLQHGRLLFKSQVEPSVDGAGDGILDAQASILRNFYKLVFTKILLVFTIHCENKYPIKHCTCIYKGIL